MSRSKSGHLIICPLSGWGHIRPEVSLALTLLSTHPSLYCTFLPDRRGAKRIAQELTCHPDLAGQCEGRYRVIPVRSEDGPDLGEDQEAIAREFGAELPRSFRQAALLGSNDGEGFGRTPSVVVLDIFRAIVYQSAVREMLSDAGLPEVKVLIMLPVTDLGWYMALGTNAEIARQLADGGDMDKIVESLADPDREVDLLDAPSVYQWELYPQIGSRKDETIQGSLRMRYGLHTALMASDGFITSGVPELEPRSHDMIRRLFGKEVYSTGYSPAEGSGTEVIPTIMNNPRYPTDDGRVEQFLDFSLETYGPGSVIYVSLGQFCWPVGRPEIIDHLVNSLLDAKPDLPFLFALASVDAELSESALKRIKASEKAEFCSWVPQRKVLKHPATGYYVCHMGTSSMYEAIMARKPMVMVPQFADQPAHAAWMTHLGCGVQLYQFSSGHDGSTFKNGVRCDSATKCREEMDQVWGDLRGDKGRAMRQRVEQVRTEIVKSWYGGRVRDDIESLAKLCTV